jgi:hypothetical protein
MIGELDREVFIKFKENHFFKNEFVNTLRNNTDQIIICPNKMKIRL